MSNFVTLVAGARPNFIKIAPLVRALNAAEMPWRLVHTGQHYDDRMSQTFFDELEIPQPHVNLEVGSASAVRQVAEVMRRLESELEAYRPVAAIVVGDVNSTLAAALTANKLRIPLAHVEAGLRSGDRSMPEEANRIITDAISDWLFTSEPAAEENLNREGIDAERIHFVGNVMIDTLRQHLDQARSRRNLAARGLRDQEYALLTLHRPANVDDRRRLESILRAAHQLARNMPVIFPMHPRTADRLRESGFEQRDDLGGFTAVEPLGYLEMLGLVEAARLVLTDSGGLQEETTALGVPCLTLRENTERPITVTAGSNRLVGWRTAAILQASEALLAGPPRIGSVPEKWDGRAAERIIAVLKAQCAVR